MADTEIKATGRRKTSIAVVKLVKGSGRIFVNGKKLTDYIGNRPAIEMLVYLLDWMDDYYNGNLEAMITHYSGDSSGKYYSKLVSIAARDGVDIQRSTYS